MLASQQMTANQNCAGTNGKRSYPSSDTINRIPPILGPLPRLCSAWWRRLDRIAVGMVACLQGTFVGVAGRTTVSSIVDRPLHEWPSIWTGILRQRFDPQDNMNRRYFLHFVALTLLKMRR